MIEQGLYLLIQNTPAIKSICVQGGGYMDQLPPGWDEVTPSWSWTRVSERPWYGLQFQPGTLFGLKRVRGALLHEWEQWFS